MIWNRLRETRSKFGLSQQAFSDKLGLSQPTYSKYEMGKASIPDELKQQLAQMGINIHWLVTGQGPMYLEDKDNGAVTLYAPPQDTYFITPKGKSEVIASQDGTEVSIPVLAQRLSAGPGQEWLPDEFSDDRITILKKFVRMYPNDRLCAAEVRGDSMTGIMLFDADIVVFVRGEVEGDGVYVITMRGEVFVKRLSFNPLTRSVSIISENKKYETIEASVDNEDLQILGKVVGWLHHHPY